MRQTTCYGIDVDSGAPVEIGFDRVIASVVPCSRPTDVMIAPGFVDIQVNGYAGVDYVAPAIPPEEIARSIHALFATGVARFYPTVITGSPDDMVSALRNLSRAKDELPEGAAMDGFHVEGPHISVEDGPRGCHPLRWVRPPAIDEFRRWQEACDGRVRIVTLSPEWPEAPAYIEAVVAEGVVAAIGHTAADERRIADAVSAGASLSTHLGNGAHPRIPKDANYINRQLADDRLMAGFIVDGIHLSRWFLTVAVRAKGVERAVLVTDAAAPAGCAPGRYRLGEQDVELKPDNRVVLAGSEGLAGSSLRMDRGIENLMRLAGLELRDAVRLATVNPAKAGNLPGRKKGLQPGERADFVLFRFDPRNRSIEVEETWMDGEKVYARA